MTSSAVSPSRTQPLEPSHDRRESRPKSWLPPGRPRRDPADMDSNVSSGMILLFTRRSRRRGPPFMNEIIKTWVVNFVISAVVTLIFWNFSHSDFTLTGWKSIGAKISSLTFRKKLSGISITVISFMTREI